MLGLFAVGFVALVVYKLFQAFKLHARLRQNKVRWTLLLPGTHLSESIPYKIPYINVNSKYYVDTRFKAFEEDDCSILCMASPFSSTPLLYLADEAACEEALTDRFTYSKPLEMYSILSFFGDNVLIVNDETHRRHRRIAAPAFSESNTSLVWQEATSSAYSWFEDIDSRAIKTDDGSASTIIDIVPELMKTALMIISSAAFGVKIPFTDSRFIPTDKHQLSYARSMSNVARYTLVKALLPDFVYNLPLPNVIKEPLQETQTAFTEFDAYLSEMIDNRLAEIENGEPSRNDLFSMFLKHMSDEKTITGSKLTSREVKGNMFIFIIAGHETTAHTLAYALGLLALYPKEQEKLYQEEARHIDAYPDFSIFSTLKRCQACFYETLRMFPPVPSIPKFVTQDTFLTAKSISEPTRQIKVFAPKGSRMFVSSASLGYDPQHWRDPDEYSPDRFIDTSTYKWNRNAFIPFSGGNRSCLGQRFAQAESVLILALLIKNYRVELREEDTRQFRAGNETFHEMKDRVLKSDLKITLTPVNLHLVFTRR